jgi:uncharacterized protein (DUF2147 family)
MNPRSVIKAVLFAAIAPIAASSAANAQDLTPVGTWLHQDKRFEVQISPCGQELCGRIVWLKAPEDAEGHPKVDGKNPDPALRTQPLLGLTVLHVPHCADQRTWTDGTIYNPDDGSDYSATVSVAEDGTLHVHAYVLTPILGKTVVFTRAG